MNRVLKRPMFRIGGSAGTGITSGLDQPRKQYANGTDPYDTFEKKIKELNNAFERYREMGGTLSYDEFKKRFAEENFNTGGRVGYSQGTTSNFQFAGMPGFLTSLGLNLLATPPQGNIFQTTAIAAKEPFNLLQAQQAEAMKTASDRAFAKELAEEEREFLSGETTRKLASAEKIAGMKTTDTTERIQAIADTKYDGDTIKASREVEFATKTYPNLVSEYGQESVATSVIDSSGLQKPKDINRFVNANPQLIRQVVYDVATGKPMKFVKNTVTNKFELLPADSADIDTTGKGQPAPKPRSFDYLSPGQKELLEDIRAGSDKEFGMGFYD